MNAIFVLLLLYSLTPSLHIRYTSITKTVIKQQHVLKNTIYMGLIIIIIII